MKIKHKKIKTKLFPSCGGDCPTKHEVIYFPKEVCSGCCGEGVIEKDFGGHTCLFRETCEKCLGTGSKEIEDTIKKKKNAHRLKKV